MPRVVRRESFNTERAVATIFPGMDPYLEDPQIWPGFHQRLIVYTADYLQVKLAPRYIAAVEERVFIEGPDREIIPDVWLRQTRPVQEDQAVALADEEGPIVVRVPGLEIHESFLTILDRHSGQRVVTVIEVVSPTNKFPGEGRKSYLAKQTEIRKSDTHLVEIDLLRTGHHVLAVAEWAARGKMPYDYLACVNRAQARREEFDLYPCRLPQRLPKVHIPLAEKDPDVLLDLQAVVTQTYEAGHYKERINYEAPCRPPLAPDKEAWANQLIREIRVKH